MISFPAILTSQTPRRSRSQARSEAVERSSRLLNDSAVTEYIDKVAQNVAKNSDARLSIVVRVIDSDVANSFTLPGGCQYVNRGLLLRLENEAELASLLARGLLTRRYVLRRKRPRKLKRCNLRTIPLVMSGPVGSSSNSVPLAFR